MPIFHWNFNQTFISMLFVFLLSTLSHVTYAASAAPSFPHTEQKLDSINSVSQTQPLAASQEIRRFKRHRKTGIGLAVASFILGITAVLTPVFGFALGVLAIVFASVALARMKRHRVKKNRKLAITGLITGIVGTVWAVVLTWLCLDFIYC